MVFTLLFACILYHAIRRKREQWETKENASQKESQGEKLNVEESQGEKWNVEESHSEKWSVEESHSEKLNFAFTRGVYKT